MIQEIHFRLTKDQLELAIINYLIALGETGQIPLGIFKMTHSDLNLSEIHILLKNETP